LSPGSVASSRPVLGSHTLPVARPHLSGLNPTEARRLPSELKLRLLIELTPPPLKVRGFNLTCGSHTFSVRSEEALARRFPSGLNATLLTPSLWPLSVASSWPVCMSQSFTVLSHDALARHLPSGLKA